MSRTCGCLRHGQDTCGSRERAVCRGWSEKLWLVIDALQVFALLWVAGCPAPQKRFPQEWCTGSSGLLAVNLDVAAQSAYSVRALNGSVADDPTTEEPWEHRHATWLIASPGVATLCLVLYLAGVKTPLYNALRGTARFVPLMERTVLGGLYLVYLPWNVFVARFSLCIEMQVLQDWQRTFVCGALHAVQLHPFCTAYRSCTSAVSWDSGLLWATMLLYAVGLPCVYAYLISSAVVFEGSKRHEDFVRATEAEFVLELSSSWSAQHYALFSSFRRAWAHARPLALGHKLVLAWTLSGTYGVQHGDIIRDAIIFALLLLPLAALLRYHCFRLKSSGYTAILLTAANFCTATPRFLMSVGFQTTLWYMLGFFLPLHHVLFGAALVILFLLLAFRPDPWPVTLRSIREGDLRVEGDVEQLGWFNDDEDGARHGEAEAEDEAEAEAEGGLSETGGGLREADGMKGVLEKARSTLLTEQLRTAEFVRCVRLQDFIRRMSATHKVLRRAKHMLHYAFEDVLEDTIVFHNTAVAKSVYDYQPLTPLIPPLRARLDIRDLKMALAGPVRRRLLLKLFACRLFIVIRTECARRHEVAPFGNSEEWGGGWPETEEQRPSEKREQERGAAGGWERAVAIDVRDGSF